MDSVSRNRIMYYIFHVCRSFYVGVVISCDYWWTLRGVDEVSHIPQCVSIHSPSQDSPEYDTVVAPCHQRAADRIVAGAVANGGLYVKLGQGLSSFNQVLPRQYIDTLKVLLDMVSCYYEL